MVYHHDLLLCPFCYGHLQTNWLKYTLGKKGYYTPIWGHEIDMDRIFVLPVGWNWHAMYLWLLPNEIRPYLGRTFTSMPRGIIEVQNHSLGGHFSKSAFTLWQVRKKIDNCWFFSQFSLIVLTMPRPNLIGIRHKVLACTCPWGHAAKCYCWSCGSDSCYRQPYPPEACWHWNFGARQVHGGSSEDHTSSEPCFVQDGPTGSLHKCLGLDGSHEEFV